MILIDTNIVIDVLGSDVSRAQRAGRAINSATRKAVGPVAYSELSPGFSDLTSFDEVLARMGIEFLPISRAALFLAGNAFKAYRLRGGPRDRMLADYLIGAQAQTEGFPLLTRDPARYRTAFPSLQIYEP